MITPEPPALDATPDVRLFFSTEKYRTCDYLLAVILTLCTAVGLPGNIITLLYFYSAKRKDFSSLMYTIVCGIDICTCIVHLPVMVGLYSGRRAGLFEKTIFCVAWSVVFYYLQRMSMFLVMLLSLSRSIKLIFLQYKIRKKYLIASFFLYTLYTAFWNVVVELFGGKNKYYAYSNIAGFCYYDIAEEPFSFIEQLVRTLTIGIPTTITTISFIVFVIKLHISQKNQVSRMNKKKYQAAVTMAIFTTLFLVCNLPCFLNNILWFILKLLDEQPNKIYGNTFMFFYSWLISDIVCTVLNAALNPVLYFYRIKHVREWSKSSVHSIRLSLKIDSNPST